MFRDLTSRLNRREGIAVALAALGVSGATPAMGKKKKWIRCEPGSAAAKCKKKTYPSCCAAGSQADCCPKDYPMCCPAGSAADCCSEAYPFCCPPGSDFACSSTPDLSGCHATMTAAGSSGSDGSR